MITFLQGECRQMMQELEPESVHCCVTSPPYYGLRDYGVDGQLGLELTPEEYTENMVEVFRGVWRVLRDDGTVWLNLGDSYNGSGKGQYSDGEHDPKKKKTEGMKLAGSRVDRLKPKDLIGIPWRVAFALQQDGWYLRQDIIWHKPNPMPESVTDRCTKAHEYIFLLTKQPKYYFDQEAVSEQRTTFESRPDAVVRNREYGYDSKENEMRGWKEDSIDMESYRGRNKRTSIKKEKERLIGKYGSTRKGFKNIEEGKTYPKRNRRSVWTVNSQPYPGAHFAVFPSELIRPCILAGCPPKGTVLDPFGGSGTTGMVAEQEGRNATLIDLNPEYIELARERCAQTSLFSS